jgi:hypothetical protein
MHHQQPIFENWLAACPFLKSPAILAAQPSASFAQSTIAFMLHKLEEFVLTVIGTL